MTGAAKTEGQMMQQPEDVVRCWEAAWNSADAEALAGLFAEDAEFVNVVGLWWHDRNRIREAHAYEEQTELWEDAPVTPHT